MTTETETFLVLSLTTMVADLDGALSIDVYRGGELPRTLALDVATLAIEGRVASATEVFDWLRSTRDARVQVDRPSGRPAKATHALFFSGDTSEPR